MAYKSESPSALPLGTERDRWAFSVLLLLAFGVRLYGLAFHSLWLDEAVSVHLASFPFSEVFRQGMSLQEPNPPLYHLALAAWMRILGSGEAAVRLLSVFAGTLYVPAVYGLGRRLFSPRVALIAMLLATVNPFLVWYSQETRMYALVAGLAAWSLYCFLRALETGRWPWWSAYTVLTVASLYTHLYAVFLLPAEFLFLLIHTRQDRSVPWRGVMAWGLSLLFFLPWLWTAWQLSGTTPSWRPALSLGTMLVACLEAFTLREVSLAGSTKAAILTILGLVALTGLLPGGLARSSRRPRWSLAGGRPNLFIVFTLVVPFLLAYVLSFRLQIFTVYYLIIIVAPFLLALAAGAGYLASIHRGVGLTVLLFAMLALLFGLRYNWTSDSRKEEWRAAARYVAEHAGPGDAVLCHADYTRIPFSYYYDGDLPIFAPFGGPVGERADVARRLEGLSGYDTVWLVQSHVGWVDPNREVEGWLASSFPTVTEQYPPGVEVKGYASIYRLPGTPNTAQPLGALFDGRIRLAGYAMDNGVYSATDDTFHPPSGWIHVTLYWEAVGDLSEDYVAVVCMTDGAGQVWGGSLDRERSGLRFYPPSSWQPGEIVRDDHDVNLNPRTPEGTYGLEVSLWSPSGEQVAASYNGEHLIAVPLGQVRIVST